MTQHYLFPKKLARSAPVLHRFGQRIEGNGVRFLFWLLGALEPERATRLAGNITAAVVGRTKKAPKVMRNLEIAFPRLSTAEMAQTADEVFRYMGVSMAELAQMERLWKEREQRFEFVANPNIEALCGGPRPAVFVTAHVGAWTLANFAPAHFGFPLTILFAPESNPISNDVLVRLRSVLPCNAMPRDNAMRTLMGELRQGRSVGLATDTRFDAGEMIPFFGVDAPTNTVPARLALRFGADLVPGRTERLPGMRFRVTFYDPVVALDPQAPKEEQIRQMSAQLNHHFEDWIRETPGQWMCMSRRWPRDAEPARGESADAGSAAN